MNLIRLATAACVTLCVAATLPSIASATDYCAPPVDGCTGVQTSSLYQALDLADDNNDADRVILGAAVYTPPPGDQFRYFNYDAPVEIVGQGRGKTFITGGLGAVLAVYGGPGTSVHDMTIRLPEKATTGMTGLMTRNTAKRIQVVEPLIQSNDHRRGVWLLDGGTLEDSTVELGTSQETVAVILGNGGVFGSGGNTLRDSTVSARTGVTSRHGNKVERSRVTGSVYGLRNFGDELSVSDTLVRITGGYGSGVRADTVSESTVTGNGLTILGPDDPDVSGVEATTLLAPDQSAHVTLANSVIRGMGAALTAAANGSGAATVSATYSDYASGTIMGSGNVHFDESHVSNVGDARFNEQPGHEFELLPDSPLIDLGEPDVAQGLDLAGALRVADGNGDGVARRDIGAFELQPPAAPAPAGGDAADTVAPVISGFRARRSRVSYRISESAGVAVKVQRRLAGRRARFRTLGTIRRGAAEGANRLRLSRRIRAKTGRPGRYRAVIVAIDAAGNRSAPRRAAFRVKPS